MTIRDEENRGSSHPDESDSEGADTAVGDTDILITAWLAKIGRLRDIADQVRWLAARLISGVADTSLHQVVEDFRRLSQSTDMAELDNLALNTVSLRNRGVGVLDPDHGPRAMRSPFVRRMPEDQAAVEAKRQERQVRHIVAYEAHIIQALEHFVQAWTALIDGSMSCDWEMLGDELPKLRILTDEVDRAFAIWLSVHE